MRNLAIADLIWYCTCE